MKRFIVVLTFCLLYLAAKADTIGPYEIYLRHKHVTTVSYSGITKVVLNTDSFSDTDTLFISRANCPGSERPVNYVCVTSDSTSGVRYDEFHARHTEMIPYKIPLSVIITQFHLTGKRDFDVVIYADTKHTERIMGTIQIHIE